MAIIGIDLGTTNSLVAVYEEEMTRVLPNRFEEHLTPSVVSLLDNGEVVVGKIARERLIVAPNNTMSAFKRHMGTTKVYDTEEISFNPKELSALVLKTICQDAKVNGKSTEHDEKDSIVISVPAYFTDLQRNATMEAARIAGLDILGIVNEPTAAALAYHLHEVDRERTIAIIDLGGGTFDVSILDMYDTVVEVKAVAGDNYLGGEDFDEAVAEFICRKYGLDYESLNLKDKNHLKFVAEELKKGFDHEANQTAQVPLEHMTLQVDLTEDEFEEACESVLSRLKEPIRKALNDAELDPFDIEEVVLVGGSTKMPLVKRQVARFFSRKPLSYLNPDEVVAKGAAVYAGLRAKNIQLSDVVMTDVCPYTLGTETMVKTPTGYERRFDPIIERNMTVPLSRMNQYVAIDPEQKELRIKVYQGEHKDPDENVYLGEIVHEIASGSVIDSMTTVRFTYDRNGILEVVTFNMKTKEEKSAIMLNSNSLSDNEIEACLHKLDELKSHPFQDDDTLFMLSKAERLSEMTTGAEKKLVDDALIFYRDTLMSNNLALLSKAKERLNEIFKHIEGA